jgi:hypothetical protein
MSKIIFCLVLMFSGISQAQATTYDYVGQPFTSFTGGCAPLFSPSPCLKVIGSVTFNFDTSSFTGSLSLSSGDTAFLQGGINPASPLSLLPVFPSSTIWFNAPLDTYGFVRELSGNFTLVDGSITSWSLFGQTGQVGCGGGPGCASGNSSVTTTPSGDQSSAFQEGSGGAFGASNDGGGIWTEEVAAAVPEPSTWAMMILGFLAISVTAYCKKRAMRPRMIFSHQRQLYFSI